MVIAIENSRVFLLVFVVVVADFLFVCLFLKRTTRKEIRMDMIWKLFSSGLASKGKLKTTQNTNRKREN